MCLIQDQNLQIWEKFWASCIVTSLWGQTVENIHSTDCLGRVRNDTLCSSPRESSGGSCTSMHSAKCQCIQLCVVKRLCSSALRTSDWGTNRQLNCSPGHNMRKGIVLPRRSETYRLRVFPRNRRLRLSEPGQRASFYQEERFLAPASLTRLELDSFWLVRAGTGVRE